MLLEMLMNPTISTGLIFFGVCLVAGFILSNMQKKKFLEKL